MLADELEKLWRLNQSGVLSDHEFRTAKERLLAGDSTGAAAGSSDGSVPGRIYGIQRQTWIMLMHLSQLLAFAGGIGFAAPIIMWAVSKDESAEANRHGLMIINWLLSSLLYGLIGGILSMALIGIPILVALFVVDPAYRPAVWGAAIWFAAGVLWFAVVGRKRLVRAPEESFALEETE